MNNELKHYGVLGMKWGVRNGSYTVDEYKAWGQQRAAKHRLKAAKIEAKAIKKGDDPKLRLKANKQKQKALKLDNKTAKINKFLKDNELKTLSYMLDANPMLKDAYKNNKLAYKVDQLGRVTSARVSNNPEEALSWIMDNIK